MARSVADKLASGFCCETCIWYAANTHNVIPLVCTHPDNATPCTMMPARQPWDVCDRHEHDPEHFSLERQNDV